MTDQNEQKKKDDIPEGYERIEVCMGCGETDCDSCPCGTGYVLRKKPARRLEENNAMPDPLQPTPTLLIKLGSLVVHMEEAQSPQGHPYDSHTCEMLRNDPEVSEWFNQMDALAFLPKKRG